MARRPTTANLLLSLGGVVLGFTGLAMVTLGSLSANETAPVQALVVATREVVYRRSAGRRPAMPPCGRR